MARKTTRIPTCCSAWPTARKPSGPITTEIVITAVITFGRSASGARTVRIASTGALTSGAQRPKAASTTVTAGHGSVIASSHSGTAMPRMATPASVVSLTRRTTWAAMRLPASAPAPKLAKKKPRIFASSSNRRTTSTGSIANSPWAAKLTKAAAASIGPSSLSRAT
jgi:hypothetical protein